MQTLSSFCSPKLSFFMTLSIIWRFTRYFPPNFCNLYFLVSYLMLVKNDFFASKYLAGRFFTPCYKHCLMSKPEPFAILLLCYLCILIFKLVKVISQFFICCYHAIIFISPFLFSWGPSLIHPCASSDLFSVHKNISSYSYYSHEANYNIIGPKLAVTNFHAHGIPT